MNGAFDNSRSLMDRLFNLESIASSSYEASKHRDALRDLATSSEPMVLRVAATRILAFLAREDGPIPAYKPNYPDTGVVGFAPPKREVDEYHEQKALWEFWRESLIEPLESEASDDSPLGVAAREFGDKVLGCKLGLARPIKLLPLFTSPDDSWASDRLAALWLLVDQELRPALGDRLEDERLAPDGTAVEAIRCVLAEGDHEDVLELAFSALKYWPSAVALDEDGRGLKGMASLVRDDPVSFVESGYTIQTADTRPSHRVRAVEALRCTALGESDTAEPTSSICVLADALGFAELADAALNVIRGWEPASGLSSTEGDDCAASRPPALFDSPNGTFVVEALVSVWNWTCSTTASIKASTLSGVRELLESDGAIERLNGSIQAVNELEDTGLRSTDVDVLGHVSAALSRLDAPVGAPVLARIAIGAKTVAGQTMALKALLGQDRSHSAVIASILVVAARCDGTVGGLASFEILCSLAPQCADRERLLSSMLVSAAELRLASGEAALKAVSAGASCDEHIVARIAALALDRRDSVGDAAVSTLARIARTNKHGSEWVANAVVTNSDDERVALVLARVDGLVAPSDRHCAVLYGVAVRKTRDTGVRSALLAALSRSDLECTSEILRDVIVEAAADDNVRCEAAQALRDNRTEAAAWMVVELLAAAAQGSVMSEDVRKTLAATKELGERIDVRDGRGARLLESLITAADLPMGLATESATVLGRATADCVDASLARSLVVCSRHGASPLCLHLIDIVASRAATPRTVVALAKAAKSGCAEAVRARATGVLDRVWNGPAQSQEVSGLPRVLRAIAVTQSLDAGLRCGALRSMQSVSSGVGVAQPSSGKDITDADAVRTTESLLRCSVDTELSVRMTALKQTGESNQGWWKYVEALRLERIPCDDTTWLQFNTHIHDGATPEERMGALDALFLLQCVRDPMGMLDGVRSALSHARNDRDPRVARRADILWSEVEHHAGHASKLVSRLLAHSAAEDTYLECKIGLFGVSNEVSRQVRMAELARQCDKWGARLASLANLPLNTLAWFVVGATDNESTANRVAERTERAPKKFGRWWLTGVDHDLLVLRESGIAKVYGEDAFARWLTAKMSTAWRVAGTETQIPKLTEAAITNFVQGTRSVVVDGVPMLAIRVRGSGDKAVAYDGRFPRRFGGETR